MTTPRFHPRDFLNRRRWGFGILLAIAISVLSPWSRAQGTQSPELRRAIERVDFMTEAELAKDNMGGVTVGIVVGPELVWTKSYGYADMERKLPATRDSVYRIGSITKQFTGFMLLMLESAGKVHLTDPVEKYFPEISTVANRPSWSPPVTLVQLATMTSGMSREPEDLPTYLRGPVSQWEQVMISALSKTKFDFEPDTRYQYSNIGYAVLGAALARAADRPFVDYVRERMFQPLGMSHTDFEPNPKIQPFITKGYEVDRDGNVDSETPQRELKGRGYKVPNGAMMTTVGDLARFVAFELGHGPESVLPKKRLEENFSRVNSSNEDLSQGYGIGFQTLRAGPHIFYGHGGGVSGWNASALVNRNADVGIVVLRNVSSGKFQVSDLARRALAVLSSVSPRNE